MECWVVVIFIDFVKKLRQRLQHNEHVFSQKDQKPNQGNFNPIQNKYKQKDK